MRHVPQPMLPYALPSCKGVVALPSSKWVVALPAQHLLRGIIQVPPLPPISLHKSIKNQTIYEITLPLSNLVDQVIQVKVITGWQRGC